MVRTRTEEVNGYVDQGNSRFKVELVGRGAWGGMKSSRILESLL